MSKHPIGPWSETVYDTSFRLIPGKDTTIRYDANGGVISSGSSSYLGSITVNSKKLRTGTNNGAPTATPSEASLVLVDWGDFIGFRALCSNKNFDGGVTKFATANGFLNPTWIASPYSPSQTAQNAQDKAFIKFIQSVGPKFESLTFLGEFASFKDDLAFVFHSLTGRHNKAYQDLITNLSKLKKGAGKDFSRVVADHWLRYQFGIKPDLDDLDSLMKALAHTVVSPMPLYKHSTVYTDKELHSVHSSSSTSTFAVDIRDSSLVKIVGKVGGTLRTEFIHTKPALAHTWGLTLENVLPAAWELLPYSWLVDYFTNVSDFLTLLTFKRAVFENGWSLRVLEQLDVSQQTPTASLISTAYGFSQSSGKLSRKSFTFNRQPVNLDTYIPDFKYELPNLRQAANIAAVATGKLIKPNRVNTLSRNWGNELASVNRLMLRG